MDPLTQALLSETFPKPGYALKLLDYPAQGQATYMCVNNIQISQYDYIPTSSGAPVTVVGGTPSTYTKNQMNQLLPLTGHIYLVIPTIMPYDALYQAASVPAGGAYHDKLVADHYLEGAPGAHRRVRGALARDNLGLRKRSEERVVLFGNKVLAQRHKPSE